MKLKSSPLLKSLILLSVLLVVITSSFAFVILTHENPDNRVEFSLLDNNNQVYTEADLSGRHTMVYFGFTSCTDVCPVHMATLTQALKSLDATDHGNSITPVFISVDPERDKPKVLSQFLTHFDDRFIGLTGDRTALAAAASSFKTYLEDAPEEADDHADADHDHNSHDHGSDTQGSYAQKSKVDSHQSNRQIAHATVVYLLNKEGKVVDYVSANKSSEAIAERIRKVL